MKLVEHNVKMKRKVNFFDEDIKYKGPTVWCIEEQMKKLADPFVSVATTKAQDFAYDTSSVSLPISVTTISEREYPSLMTDENYMNIDMGNSKERDMGNVDSQATSKTHMKNVNKDPALENNNTECIKVDVHDHYIRNVNHVKHKRVEKLQISDVTTDESSSDIEYHKEKEYTPYRNPPHRRGQRRRIQPKLKHKSSNNKLALSRELKSARPANAAADNPAFDNGVANFYLPVYLLPPWDKLQTIYIKEANAKLMYHYCTTLLRYNLTAGWLEISESSSLKTQSEGLQYQLENLKAQYRKEVLRAHIHEEEMKLVQLNKQRGSILKEVEIVLKEHHPLDYDIGNNQQYVNVTSLVSPIGNVTYVLEDRHFEIPENLLTIWNDVLALQVEEANTRLQYHYFNSILKNRSDTKLPPIASDVGKIDNAVKPSLESFKNQIIQLNVDIEAKLSHLELQRKTRLRKMEILLISANVENSTPKTAKSDI